MPPEKEEKHEDLHEEMLRLTRENNEFIKKNHEYLRKINRRAAVSMWISVVWYTIVIGLPFAFYFYIVEPYFTTLGADYETFREGMAEIPGLRGLENLLPKVGE